MLNKWQQEKEELQDLNHQDHAKAQDLQREDQQNLEEEDKLLLLF